MQHREFQPIESLLVSSRYLICIHMQWNASFMHKSRFRVCFLHCVLLVVTYFFFFFLFFVLVYFGLKMQLPDNYGRNVTKYFDPVISNSKCWHDPIVPNSKCWFTTSFLQPLPQYVSVLLKINGSTVVTDNSDCVSPDII